MPTASIPFRVTQPFPVSAPDAYAWATDFDPKDIALFGRKGRRKVIRLTDETLILADTFVNDDLDRAIAEVAGIITSYRTSSHQGKGPEPGPGAPPSNGD